MAKVTAAGIGIALGIGAGILGRGGGISSRVSAYDNRKKGQNQLKRPPIQPAAMAEATATTATAATTAAIRSATTTAARQIE